MQVQEEEFSLNHYQIINNVQAKLQNKANSTIMSLKPHKFDYLFFFALFFKKLLVQRNQRIPNRNTNQF